MVYGSPVCAPERGPPERWLALVRGHGQIEHKLHWVRDVTFEEDRSQVRCGHIPQVMAARAILRLGCCAGQATQHCRRVPPLCGPTGPGIGPHWY